MKARGVSKGKFACPNNHACADIVIIFFTHAQKSLLQPCAFYVLNQFLTSLISINSFIVEIIH